MVSLTGIPVGPCNPVTSCTGYFCGLWRATREFQLARACSSDSLPTLRMCNAHYKFVSEHYGFSKTQLASENFVDVFSLLARWQLDSVRISCRPFCYILSAKMDTVCLREFASIRLPIDYLFESTFNASWCFTANGEEQDLSTSFSQVEEAMEDMAKRITSSAVKCLEFTDLHFTDEMLEVCSFF